MTHISSRENALYKQVQRLLAGKGVQTLRGKTAAHGQAQAVLEGIHLCQAWLEHHGIPQLALFDAARLDANPELAALARALPHDHVVSCEPQLMSRLSGVIQGQGVLFVVLVPRPVQPSRITQNTLWLDRIQDPGNVGTLLRTAGAAGIRQAYLSPGCAGAWSPKVLRSAQGAHFVISIHEDVDLYAELQSLDIPLLVTALEGGGSLYDNALPNDCVWVFGNEGQGVQPAILERADRRVFIPQDISVESLNVAVAAGICLFEHRRQRLRRLRKPPA